ncbi:hypothetical protein [Yoonia sp.]|uniref:hypothetical protein n=1 Tax=Yoonia sp. TaxID=2212373 RepID=UPI0025DC6C61|nr:hypothetical protein [Yoonia sp.]
MDLCFGVGGAKAIVLAPLTGADEAAAAAPDHLLRRLALTGERLVHGEELAQMTIGDRDRAIAALFRQLYGDVVQADAVCAGCAATYEIRFSLAALTAGRVPDGTASGDPAAITLGDTRLRLPQMRDFTGAPDDLIARLVLTGPDPDPQAAEHALEGADPALELDLTGTCPECDTVQATPFSMAGFLQASMQRDRAFLAREVHLIASAYHWSLAEIHSLTRHDRQTYARLLIAEREAGAVQIRRAS